MQGHFAAGSFLRNRKGEGGLQDEKAAGSCGWLLTVFAGVPGGS